MSTNAVEMMPLSRAAEEARGQLSDQQYEDLAHQSRGAEHKAEVDDAPGRSTSSINALAASSSSVPNDTTGKLPS
jgi:hypothetical protein